MALALATAQPLSLRVATCSLAGEEGTCAVCYLADSVDGNAILFCDGCGKLKMPTGEMTYPQ